MMTFWVIVYREDRLSSRKMLQRVYDDPEKAENTAKRLKIEQNLFYCEVTTIQAE